MRARSESLSVWTTPWGCGLLPGLNNAHVPRGQGRQRPVVMVVVGPFRVQLPRVPFPLLAKGRERQLGEDPCCSRLIHSVLIEHLYSGPLLRLSAQQGADSLLQELRDQILFLLGGALSWPTPSRGGTPGRGRRSKPLLSQGPRKHVERQPPGSGQLVWVHVHRFS